MNLHITSQINNLISQIQSQIIELIILLEYHKVESQDYYWLNTQPYNQIHMLNKLNMAIDLLKGYEVNQDGFDGITYTTDMGNHKLAKLNDLSLWLDCIYKHFEVTYINKNADQLLTSSCSVIMGFTTTRWIPQKSKNYL